ncbi:Chlorophyll(ide) b reductase NOL, chloroplastic, partial [Cucurbita argyrosperma subsp. argyrosperma]
MASFSSSSLFFPATFISHNHHGFFFSPPSGIRRLSLCKLESFSRSIGCSREVFNIRTSGVVKWNSVSIKAEGFQQTEPMVPPYNVLITGSTKESGHCVPATNYNLLCAMFAAYGATKRSVVHLTKSLQAELRMQDVKNVVVHNLSPGMVTTDLLMSGANTKQAKFFINVLAEPPEVVAEYLVPNIRSIPANGSTRPTYIRFLTGLKAYSQIFSRLAFGARRNRYLLED